MKKISFLLLVFLLATRGMGYAELLNGSFETGDFTGWNVTIDWGLLENQTPAPGGYAETATVFSYYSSEAGGIAKNLLPAQGQHFANLSTASSSVWYNPGYQYQYTTSIQQEIQLNKGDHVTGQVAFYNGDFISQDDAWVKIYENGGEVSNPWFAVSGDPRHNWGGDVNLNGDLSQVMYSELWPWYSTSGPTWGSDEWSAWTQTTPFWATWVWTVPETSTYTLELAVRTRGDVELKTKAFFDNVQVPESSTMVLLVVGLIGVFRFRKKFWK